MFDVTLPLKIPNYFINLDNYEMTNFTFVTAADPEHFNETRDAIGGFQQVFPDHSIVYYDLGLSTKEAEEVGYENFFQLNFFRLTIVYFSCV